MTDDEAIAVCNINYLFQCVLYRTDLHYTTNVVYDTLYATSTPLLEITVYDGNEKLGVFAVYLDGGYKVVYPHTGSATTIKQVIDTFNHYVEEYI